MKRHVYDLLGRVIAKLAVHLFDVSGSFPSFLLRKISEKGFEHLIVPAINRLIRDGLFLYDIKKGEILSIKVTQAREIGYEEYNDAVDDIIH